ncbi:MAG: 30S ribosome-binding factor RbfA [Bacteroidetes bacterium]|nr:30S ribosome-binding factor RbfA [Bacteroidota bacterium]
MSVRTEKVAQEIKNKLNQAMSKDLSEISGLGLVTVSKVTTTPDLKIAKIYLSFLGNKIPVEECLEKLEARKKHIRFLLAKLIILKYMPELQFYHDDTIEYADRIQKLINEIHEKDSEHDPQ